MEPSMLPARVNQEPCLLRKRYHRSILVTIRTCSRSTADTVPKKGLFLFY